MSGPRKPQGYTIVEVMIFLAVSGALLVSAMLLVNGQQQRTEFSQSSRDIEASLRDIMNDVSTGYYVNNGTFSCNASPSGPNLTSLATEQGTNKGCILVGRAVQFSPDGDSYNYQVYSIAGLRQKLAGTSVVEVSSLDDAKPVLIAPRTTNTSVPDDSQVFPVPAGLKTGRVYYDNGSGEIDTGLVGFITGFGQSDAAGNLTSGSIKGVDLLAVNGTTDDTPEQVAEQFTVQAQRVVNPLNGVAICFEGEGVSQYALIKLGGNARRLTTELIIGQGGCPA